MADWSHIRLCPDCGAGNPLNVDACVRCGAAIGKIKPPTPRAAIDHAIFWRRAAAKVIDFPAASFISVTFMETMGKVFSPDLNAFMKAHENVMITLFYAFYVAYMTSFTELFSTSPGKMLFRLKVVTAQGTRVSAKTAFWRSAFEMLSLGVFFIGYVVAYFDPECRTWHDRIWKTRVIRVRRRPR